MLVLRCFSDKLVEVQWSLRSGRLAFTYKEKLRSIGLSRETKSYSKTLYPSITVEVNFLLPSRSAKPVGGSCNLLWNRGYGMESSRAMARFTSAPAKPWMESGSERIRCFMRGSSGYGSRALRHFAMSTDRLRFEGTWLLHDFHIFFCIQLQKEPSTRLIWRLSMK